MKTVQQQLCNLQHLQQLPFQFKISPFYIKTIFQDKKEEIADMILLGFSL